MIILKPLIEALNQLKARISGKKQAKNINWVTWAAALLKRRNILIDLSVCAYGNTQIVDRVKPFGAGSIFWSKACDGCSLGSTIIKLHKENKIPPKDLEPFCALLQTGLLTRDSVKPGDIYELPSLRD